MICNPVVVVQGLGGGELGTAIKNYIMQNGQKVSVQYNPERNQMLTCAVPTGSAYGIYCKPHAEYTEYMQDFVMLVNPPGNNQTITSSLNDGDTLNAYDGGLTLNLYTPYIGEVYVYGLESVVLE